MVKRLGGSRHKTRYKLSKAAGEHGKIRVTAFLQTFQQGDYVSLAMDPAVPRGRYHPRFHGKTGIVLGAQGGSYRIKINDKDKAKTILAHPVHLKRL